jgi:enoyl-CoA hydratase/carnithine racemase
VPEVYETIKLKQKQTTTWITLNRPRKLNAINDAMLQELTQVLEITENNQNTRCLIITGKGQKAFSTGADITELQKLTQNTAQDFSRKGQQVFKKIEAYSKPVVAAINGYCLGGGLELALSCDFRLASENAKMGFPEMKLGIIPGWGGTQRLPEIVGTAEAKRMIILGDVVNAYEALKMGLVGKVVAHGKLESEAETVANRLHESLPKALRHAKQAINSATKSSLKEGLKKETFLFAQLFSTQETKERIEAFLSTRNEK